MTAQTSIVQEPAHFAAADVLRKRGFVLASGIGMPLRAVRAGAQTDDHIGILKPHPKSDGFIASFRQRFLRRQFIGTLRCDLPQWSLRVYGRRWCEETAELATAISEHCGRPVVAVLVDEEERSEARGRDFDG